MEIDDVIRQLLELKAQGVSRVYIKPTLDRGVQLPIQFDRDKDGDGLIIGV